MSGFTDVDRTLVARALLDGSSFTDAAERVLTALADAGRLTPLPAEVAEQWTYAQPGWPDGPLVALHWDHVFDSQREAEEQFGHYRIQFPGRDWSGVCIARRVTIEGPWVAADGTP
jgi:hypothetical protein